ncbi:MAG: carotenoid oxygenase family protein [Gammaproteobacteria bacterium]|nr:carotenoid oxygenase family protein [Gammaproteobacteria bacterium]
MKGLLIDFLPWIAFALIMGASPIRQDAAIILAFVMCAIFDRQHLKQGFILSWGSLLFFGFMLIAAVLFKNPWIDGHIFLLSNLVLAAIVGFSVLIRQPFTMQYAKEKVPEAFWGTALFRQINYSVSIIWGLSFLLTALIDWKFNTGAGQFISYIPTLFAIWFTKWFPKWYRAKKLATKPIINPQPNPDLMASYAPVHDELDVQNLKVIGEIPADLNGVYMRNGPNPQFEPISYTYPFDGDGMIHAITIKEGKADYRNRYVETNALLKERKAGKALYSGVLNLRPMDPKWAGPEDEPFAVKNGAFIHIIRHADQYLALWEGGPAYEMTRDLKTKGEWTPVGAKKPIDVCAHTRYDPLTGELWFVNYSITPPFLSLHKVDKKGQLLQSWDIEKSHSTMIHDFVLTKNYVIVFDCPMVFDLKKMVAGGPLLSWQPELGTRIGIMPRTGGKMQWFQTEAFFVFHFANAYEQGHEIIVDFVRHEKLDLSSVGKGVPPMLYRSIINTQNGNLKHVALDDRLVEFPRIREDMDTLEHRYIYTPTKTTDIVKRRLLNALVKYDVKTQGSEVHDFGRYAEIGEAVFAAKENSQSEDDGYLMLYVYDSQTEQSELVILDARNISAEPLARIKMPRRIPVGLHGSWMPV